MNTSNTFLMRKATAEGTYAKVCDITSYPDMFTAPPKLDSTTLSNTAHTYEKDIADTADLTFGVLYKKADFTTIKGYEGTTAWYAVYFGASSAGVPDGSDGIFEWQGDIFASIKGGSVGALREGEITCYPSTEIDFS